MRQPTIPHSKEQALAIIKAEIEQLRKANLRPLLVLLTEIKCKYGESIIPFVRELIKEGELFYGSTINDFWISTEQDVIS